MRYRSNSKKAAVITIAVLIAAAVIAGWTGFASTRSALRVGYVGQESWDRWSGSYIRLSGTMEKSLHPEGALRVEVTTESGGISIEITDQDGGVIFAQEQIGTADYDVEASGTVTVRIQADGHKGSFRIGPP